MSLGSTSDSVEYRLLVGLIKILNYVYKAGKDVRA
jgi:hypothetical protein